MTADRTLLVVTMGISFSHMLVYKHFPLQIFTMRSSIVSNLSTVVFQRNIQKQIICVEKSKQEHGYAV